MSAIVERLQARAARALGAWGLPDQQPQLLKYRENAVFKVRLADGGKAALRLHRAGYHAEPSLLSELQWMEELRDKGLAVPRPIGTPDGRLLVALDGDRTQFADLIGWIDGNPLGESGVPLPHDAGQLAAIFFAVGSAMAEMHTIADRWTPPAAFIRPAWDCEGLLGDNPLWGPFWDRAPMGNADRTHLAGLRIRLRQKLEALSPGLDFGLIHADLVRENVFVADKGVAFIDFDDCGFGWRLFDIATALLRNRSEPHYETIRSTLIDGYRSRRALGAQALEALPLFMLLRSLTYIGWVGGRPDLPDATDRMHRYIAEAKELALAL